MSFYIRLYVRSIKNIQNNFINALASLFRSNFSVVSIFSKNETFNFKKAKLAQVEEKFQVNSSSKPSINFLK